MRERLRSSLFPYPTLFRSPPPPPSRARPAARRRAPPAASPPDRGGTRGSRAAPRSEEHTSELQSLTNLVCRLLLEKKNNPRYARLLNLLKPITPGSITPPS